MRTSTPVVHFDECRVRRVGRDGEADGGRVRDAQLVQEDEGVRAGAREQQVKGDRVVTLAHVLRAAVWVGEEERQTGQGQRR